MRPIVFMVLALLPASARAEAPSFELDIQPIFTALGCNAGACHGKARGQNGFSLSLLGFDADHDFAAITQEARGRRLFPASPSNSLLLLKASAQLPHGGGQRITLDDANYKTLHRWIAAGAPRRIDNEPRLERITVAPKQREMKPGDTQSLTVTAHFSNGALRDVTPLTAFQSSDAAVAAVDKLGKVKTSTIPGEAVVMARYMHQLDTFTAINPLPGEVPDELYAKLTRNNFIDDLVYAKLKSLRITPSDQVDDAKFLRRVHVDLIGRLPTTEEAKAFLTSTDSDKREKLIDALLDRPEYADAWASKWGDLLRPNPYRVGIKAVFNYDNWIRQSFRDNKPYDQFVRELVTAQGSTWDNGAAVLFRDRRSPDEITTIVSQLFLGIRLECAKCHHHPFEKWSQDDYYSFAAYFAKLRHKGEGLSPPISGGEEVVFSGGKGEVTHPITGKALVPRPLFDVGRVANTSFDDADPRVALADWITAPGNDYFEMVAANRIWAELMGRPLVDPVDDLRVTNPPSNEPLLRALGRYFREVKFDQKKLIRAIALSHVYSLSSIPSERNVKDTRYHSRHYRTRMSAEEVLDAASDITGIREDFQGMPRGSRAMQLWTTRINSTTLDTFGRPDPNQDPPCERIEEPTVTQALHLMMSPQVYTKVASDGSLAAKLGASKASPAEITEQLYLTVYSRYPSEKEKAYVSGMIEKAANKRAVMEDLLWSLFNTPEFLFKD
jgi:hypothetical protein